MGCAVFRVDGGERVLEFAGRTTRLTDLIGLRYLARLLAAPGREFHVLDLVAVARGVLPASRDDDSVERGSIACVCQPELAPP